MKWIKSKKIHQFFVLFWIFFLGSLGGFLGENLITFLSGEWVLRQGLLYEPLIPVYGCGLVLMYLLYQQLDKIKNKHFFYWIGVFLLVSFLGGAVEYLFSFLQEKIFGTVSWTYYHMDLNINGRTTVFHAMFWGLMFFPFAFWIYPLLKKIQNLLYEKSFFLLTWLVFLIFFADATLSFLATMRREERRDDIAPSNILDVFLDKNYPDERIDKIYNNVQIKR